MFSVCKIWDYGRSLDLAVEAVMGVYGSNLDQQWVTRKTDNFTELNSCTSSSECSLCSLFIYREPECTVNSYTLEGQRDIGVRASKPCSNPIKAHIVSSGKKVYPHCFVLVIYRNMSAMPVTLI